MFSCSFSDLDDAVPAVLACTCCSIAVTIADTAVCGNSFSRHRCCAKSCAALCEFEDNQQKVSRNRISAKAISIRTGTSIVASCQEFQACLYTVSTYKRARVYTQRWAASGLRGLRQYQTSYARTGASTRRRLAGSRCARLIHQLLLQMQVGQLLRLSYFPTSKGVYNFLLILLWRPGNISLHRKQTAMQ